MRVADFVSNTIELRKGHGDGQGRGPGKEDVLVFPAQASGGASGQRLCRWALATLLHLKSYLQLMAETNLTGLERAS